MHYYKKCMCLYHSVATNIETDLLEVLDLNQITNFFIRRMQAFVLKFV